jgi:hypothetical protein
MASDIAVLIYLKKTLKISWFVQSESKVV